MDVSGRHQAPPALLPEKIPSTHWMGSYLGPRYA